MYILQVMREAIKEMYIQVRDMVIKNGIARKGLLIRHLVMPEGIENAGKILEFIARRISIRTYVIGLLNSQKSIAG